MNYLIVVAVQFFRWALAWVARELVLLIVMALVTNFFAEFRALLLTFMDFIKEKVLAVSKKLTLLSSELESSLLELTKKVDTFSLAVNNFNDFLLKRVEKMRSSIASLLKNKVARVKNIIENAVLDKILQIKNDVIALPIETMEKNKLLKKIDLAEQGARRTLSAADRIEKSVNIGLDKHITQITKRIPTVPTLDTPELKNKLEELRRKIEQNNQAINDEIDLVFSKFNEAQVREILQKQILSADEAIFEKASDVVSQKVKKRVKTPKGKKIHWLNLDHREKAHSKHAKNFKMNDIYRILVENFDRDERIALALRFAKKDHFRLGK